MKGEQTSRNVEVKVSSDQGETWFKRTINFGKELDESGLRPGEIFIFQNEQYEVKAGDEGLRIAKLEKKVGRPKTVNSF